VWASWQRDAWLVAAVLLVDLRAYFAPFNEWAWLTALFFTAGAASLLLLPRVLTAQTSHWVGRAVVGAALLHVPLMAWQTAHGLPAVGWTDGPGSRYAAVVIALAVPLASLCLVPILVIGLYLSQSYLACAAAAVGVAVTMTRRVEWVCLGLVGAAVIGFSGHRAWPMWHERLEAWTLIWPDLKASPLLGLGPGSWGTTVPLRQWTSSVAEKWPHAHSDLVEWGVEMGLVGILLLLGWITCATPRLWHSPVRGSLIALTVLSLGFHPLHTASLAPWALLLLGVGLRNPDVRIRGEARCLTLPSGRGSWWRCWRAPAG